MTLKKFIEHSGLSRGASCKDVAFYVARLDIENDDTIADIIGHYLLDVEEFIFTYENLI